MLVKKTLSSRAQRGTFGRRRHRGCRGRAWLPLLYHPRLRPLAGGGGPAQRVARECLELGMMTSVVRGGLGIFRIAPPITIEPAVMPLGLEIFDRALARAVH